jgi:hypothetical protein
MRMTNPDFVNSRIPVHTQPLDRPGSSVFGPRLLFLQEESRTSATRLSFSHWDKLPG